MNTVTELTVTSLVWAVERSTFFKRAGYFLCLCLSCPELLWREPEADLLPFGMAPDAPGNVAACWATSAELRRGLRVEVPLNKIHVFLLVIVM